MRSTKTRGRVAAGNPGGAVAFSARRFFPLLFFCAAFPFALASCASVSPVDGRPLAEAASPGDALPLWRPFPTADSRDGVYCLAYFSGRILRPRLEFHALRLCLLSPVLGITVAAGGGGGPEADGVLGARVSSFVRDNDLLAGINALPFDPVSGREGEPRTNVGVVIADGRVISPPDQRFYALVFFRDGGAAIKRQSEIGRAENIENAVGGFGRILEGYRPVPRVLGLEARHPRSAAGVSSCGGFLYLLAIDGRRRGSVGGTEAETALLLRALGAAEGINFDGGGSTALAARFHDGRVRVMNTPIHGQIRGRERAVAGVLGIGKRADR